MIETYLLEHLSAFRKHKTLSETAECLHLTQPTLTRSMNKLEEAFGVPLFIRKKKRIYLNSNGEVAADYADEILELHETMMQQVKLVHRLSNTFSVGFCAPGPLYELTAVLSNHFSDKTVSTEIKSESDLIKGLSNDLYQMIVLNHPLGNDQYYSEFCCSEQLNAALVPEHRFSGQKYISFKMLDGEVFLMASNVGIWEGLVREKMPSSTFLMQENTDSLKQVAESSSISGFSTDITLRVLGRRGNRLSIPFSDAEAYMDFYCICLDKNRASYAGWFDELAAWKKANK